MGIVDKLEWFFKFMWHMEAKHRFALDAFLKDAKYSQKWKHLQSQEN